ncbi:hypothetical protein LF1_07160 [Rubripirellula obstinata]|uniref:Uncharacterized protein n=1 Tax=Rubripirellula obstinata TaxID=406547 RepID=A0A5B1CF41_9BACT|nr:hypothetical protein LF1_07160 [Rubripirellula obstinata]
MPQAAKSHLSPRFPRLCHTMRNRPTNPNKNSRRRPPHRRESTFKNQDLCLINQQHRLPILFANSGKLRTPIVNHPPQPTPIKTNHRIKIIPPRNPLLHQLNQPRPILRCRRPRVKKLPNNPHPIRRRPPSNKITLHFNRSSLVIQRGPKVSHRPSPHRLHRRHRIQIQFINHENNSLAKPRSSRRPNANEPNPTLTRAPQQSSSGDV